MTWDDYVGLYLLAVLIFMVWFYGRLTWRFVTQLPALRRAGWTYNRYAPELVKSFGRAYPFVYKPGFTHVLRGEVAGMRTLICRHHWRDSRVASQTMVVLTLPRPLPGLVMPTTERYLKRGIPAFQPGGPRAQRVPVVLPNGKGGHKTWNLWAADRKVAEAVFTERVRDLTNQRPGLGWRIEGHAMIAWACMLGPKASIAVAERCVQILDEIPDWVWHEGEQIPNPWPGPCPERPA